ncbi:prealbumin-like fold domain-containing protein [Enemella dayhoffiae]|uniref:prealbumin-like fold domain-containing protein n=1 Tax=Enemella dayhoffiae TaxID=2016507 RepID=UPI0011402788|nr:hypothetical protein [Enemella dayhoffiae]
MSISGSPYHMRLVGWGDAVTSDSLNIGYRDLSLSSDAVIYPGRITIIKQANPQSASTIFSFTASPSPLADFILNGGNAPPGNTKVFDNLTSFTTYTVTESVTANWALTGLTCTVDASTADLGS